MGIVSFFKEAGEKLFGKGEAKAAQEAAEREASAANLERLNRAAGDAIGPYRLLSELGTGGMGAVSPVPFATPGFMFKVEEKVIKPTIAGLQKENIDYKGFIFFGLVFWQYLQRPARTCATSSSGRASPPRIRGPPEPGARAGRLAGRGGPRSRHAG